MRGPLPSHAVIWVASLLLLVPPPAALSRAGAVSGRVAIVERGNKSGTDVGQAVVWLEAAGAKPAPARAISVITEGKEFRPRVSVVTVGSTVTFPNNDPFNHNVFSLSSVSNFNLGRYPRGESRARTFTKSGIVKVYCQIHSHMSATIMVFDHPYFVIPQVSGQFELANVPPGDYTLVGWHERVGERTIPVHVDRGKVTNVVLRLPVEDNR